MCIITVSEEPFSGGQELAKSLAERLGLRYVDPAILVERAAAWGGDRQKLRAVLESGPTFRDRFTRHRLNQLLLLQAALAKDIRDGHAVCYGAAADLLTLETELILRIGLRASHEFRQLQVQERLKFQEAEAEKYLKTRDRSRSRWLTHLFGVRKESSISYDLVIDVEKTSIGAAYRMVSEIIHGRGRFSTVDLALMENFALSTRIKAGLAQNPETAHLDLDVEIRGDTATLRGIVRSSEEIDAVKRALLPIPANMKVDFSQMQLGNWDYAPPFFSSRPARPGAQKQETFLAPSFPRVVWTLAGLSAVATTFFLTLPGSWFRNRWFTANDAQVQSFAGVITDSRCGTSHLGSQLTADCVRSCVKRSGAKYVLNDGMRNFVLSDQQVGEELAAQRVVASGVLDTSTGDLRIRSIRAAR